MDGLRKPRGLLAPALLLLTAGCASLPADHGGGDVAALLKERGRDVSQIGDENAGRKLLQELAAKPLTVDDAVRLALVNNPRLKAEYARLGFAAADVYDAGRLSNPTLSASVLFTRTAGLVDEVSFGLAQSFTNLLLLPARSRFAEGEFERVKQSVGAEVLNLAADVESAYYRLVGTQQVAAMRETVAKAAQVSADLAQRFFDAGNINRRELALEQAAATQARLDLLGAQTEVTEARTRLDRLLGVGTGNGGWTVAEKLPMPLEKEDQLPSLLERADRSRLDLAAARKQVGLFADVLGVTRRFRYLGEVEVGVETTRIAEGARLTGPALALQLPIFNQGTGAVTRAQAHLQQVESELLTLEIEIINAIRRAHAGVLNSKARAEQFRDALIPQREEIVRRTQEEVNFMLEGQFQLLLVKQQEYDAYQGYLEAVRDYWLARVDLARAVGAPLPSAARVGDATLDVEILTTPKDSGMEDMDHSGHEMPQKKDEPPQDEQESPPAEHKHHHGEQP